jgi:hypothetical protein
VLWVFLSMLVILALAGLVAAYVAYPRRGEQLPAAPWVGDALQRGVDALPTLHNQQPHLHLQAQPQPQPHR